MKPTQGWASLANSVEAAEEAGKVDSLLFGQSGDCVGSKPGTFGAQRNPRVGSCRVGVFL